MKNPTTLFFVGLNQLHLVIIKRQSDRAIWTSKLEPNCSCVLLGPTGRENFVRKGLLLGSMLFIKVEKRAEKKKKNRAKDDDDLFEFVQGACSASWG
jgi:hypothetical protein